jgi:HAMP domain-containing protein
MEIINLITETGLLPLIAMIAIALGLLIVWVYWMISRARLRRREQSPEEDAEEQAATEPPEQAVATTVTEPPPFRPPPAPDQPPEDVVEVFRVMRDLADGALVVEIGGRRYSRLTEITDGQVGRRFINNVRALAEFAMLSTAQPSSPPPPPPPSTSVPPPMPEPPPLAERLRAAISQPPPRPRPAGAPSMPVGETPLSEGSSLADQIEDMLQYRLMNNPALSKRSIHVRPGPHGGVRIEVDGHFFDGVGEVADDEVRAFIQDTIREWEARQ